MRVLVTAGPTREHIDPARFVSNASSGRMGCAVAAAAIEAGHDVTLLAGPVELPAPRACRVVRFVSVADLRDALRREFAGCDALVMAAAVGDFRPESKRPHKLRRGDGPVALRLVPTADVLAEVTERRRDDQIVVAFAAEDGSGEQAEARAREKMAAKGADYVVVNPVAAMGAEQSEACILAPGGVALPWARRTKAALAGEIVKLLGERKGQE